MTAAKEKGVPDCGTLRIITCPAGELLRTLDRKVLFRSRWKMRKGGDAYLDHLLREQPPEKLPAARAVYGYFPCRREGAVLRVGERYAWKFPGTQKGAAGVIRHWAENTEHCIAVTALTLGDAAAEHMSALYDKGDYAEYFLFHGLAAELTETFARRIEKGIAGEWGLSVLRRSFGHPGYPELSSQGDILELLDAAAIGIRMTPEGQLMPEFSSTAVIIPAAAGTKHKGQGSHEQG